MNVINVTNGLIPMIAEIESRSFGDPWSAEGFMSSLESGGYVFLAAEDGGTVCGYILGTVSGDSAYIDKIAISPEHRRKGVGALLINEFARIAEGSPCCGSLALDVRASNTGAVAFYERCGFTAAGRRKRSYTSPTEDGITMVKALNGGNKNA